MGALNYTKIKCLERVIATYVTYVTYVTYAKSCFIIIGTINIRIRVKQALINL